MSSAQAAKRPKYKSPGKPFLLLLCVCLLFTHSHFTHCAAHTAMDKFKARQHQMTFDLKVGGRGWDMVVRFDSDIVMGMP